MKYIYSLFAMLLILSVKAQNVEDKYIKIGYETVYGKTYMYQIKTPNEYTAEIQKKSMYDGHIKFHPKTSAFKAFEFYILDKISKKTKDAIGYITKSYISQHKNLVVNNIDVKNFPYECVAKMYSVDKQFYNYVFYINCGSKYNYWIIASAHSEKRPLNAKELEIFYNTMLSLNPIK